jgi:ABC-2 type transport system ATP-binding protein
MDFAIETQDLHRIFKARKHKKSSGERDVVALDGANVQIMPGEIFGLLGPNGAGKTTLIKILSTLLAPTSGRAYVDGIDVMESPAEVRKRITMVSGGEHCGYGILTVRENIWMFSQFHGVQSDVAKRQISELLAVLDMSEDGDTKVNRLSTGMRQKMNIIRGFVCDPKILFLDEPTLGLDVQVSRAVRGLITRWAIEHPERTTLLTTHYMAEADELCDRVAIIHDGKVLACDTPAELKRVVAGRIAYRLEMRGIEADNGFSTLPGVLTWSGHISPSTGTLKAHCLLTGDDAIGPLLSELTEQGGRLVSLTKDEPTLEDVFIHLVGHTIANGDE